MYDRLLSHLQQTFTDYKNRVGDEVGDEPWDYLYQFGNEANALLYVQLFCPRFVEVDGSVLLDGPIKAADCPDLAESFRRAKAASPSVADAERGFTWLELPYLFIGYDQTEEGVMLLGEFVAELWRARLHYLYHPRKFEVSVVDDGIDVVHVRFREIR